jgi:hypothetical protein
MVFAELEKVGDLGVWEWWRKCKTPTGQGFFMDGGRGLPAAMSARRASQSVPKG